MGNAFVFSFSISMTLHRLSKKKLFTDFKTVKKSHSPYVQKPVLAEIDIVDVRESLQQLLSVVPVHVNTIFRMLIETFWLISVNNITHEVCNPFLNTLYKTVFYTQLSNS